MFFIKKRIDQYVLSEVLGPLLGSVAVFCFILLMFQMLRIADSLIIHGAPIMILLKIVGLMLLSFLQMVIPISFLISVLIAFGRLSSDSELVAMKANGISIDRLAKPVLILSLVVSVLSLGLNLDWLPKVDRELKKTFIRLTNTKAVSAIREGTFTTGFFDLLIYADKVDNDINRLEKVFIFDERNKKNPLTVVAREGALVPVKTTSDLGVSTALKLYHGNIHSNQIQKNVYQKMDFKEYQLFLKVEAGADTATIKPGMLPWGELKRKMRTDPVPRHRTEFKTEMWRRFALALAPLLFVWVGIGLGTVRTRAIRSGATILTLVIIFPYWALMGLCTKLGYSGALYPAIAMMIPNLMLAIVGYKAFKSARW